MEPKFNTSFIPKKSLQGDVVGGSSGGDRYVGRRTIHGPGYFLSMLIFLTSAVASIGLFGYTKIVENSINEKIERLKEQKATFDLQSIDLLIRADNQITSANKLLKQHVAVSELFALLEKITLKNIQYTELSYAGLPDESAKVGILGTTRTFQNVALQTEQYREEGYLSNQIVRELERLESNMIRFSLDFSVDKRLVSFSSFLNNTSSNRNLETVSTPVVEEVEVVTEEDSMTENAEQETTPDANAVIPGDS